MKRLDRDGQESRAGAACRRRSFVHGDEGSLIIFGLFMLIIMFAAGGMGADFMRAEVNRTRLQSTLDRAVLAAASLDQPLPAKDVVLDYFDRTGLGDYVTADDIDVVESLTSRRVEVNTSMTIGTTLLQFAGIDRLTVPAAGAAAETAGQTEISLVLDVSGSMGSWSRDGGATKLDILKSAAKQFVNIMLCNPAYPNATDSTNCNVPAGKVSVSLIPYAEQVLLSNYMLGLFNVTSEHTSSACVTFDPTDFTTTAITPTQLLLRTGHFDPWSNSGSKAHNWTCNPASERQILPIEGSAAKLRAAIDDLAAGGNTSIDLGVKWGAALLDPAMEPIINTMIDAHWISEDFRDRPITWTETRVEKVIVVMTDGVNTDQHYLADDHRDGLSPVWKADGQNRYSIYNESTGMYYWDNPGRWEDHPYGTGTITKCHWEYSYRTGYRRVCTEKPEGTGATQMQFVDLWAAKPWAWYDQFSWLDRAGSQYGNGEKNTMLHNICEAAKDEDITIYTVGFETTYSSGAVLQDCASSDAHYFDVQGTDLADAFSAIARQISKLRLVN